MKKGFNALERFFMIGEGKTKIGARFMCFGKGFLMHMKVSDRIGRGFMP